MSLDKFISGNPKKKKIKQKEKSLSLDFKQQNTQAVTKEDFNKNIENKAKLESVSK